MAKKAGRPCFPELPIPTSYTSCPVDRLANNRLFLYTQKTGVPVYIPRLPVVKALDVSGTETSCDGEPGGNRTRDHRIKSAGPNLLQAIRLVWR